jgi:hypothetical protein
VYHDGTARPWVADTGDGLQSWRIAAKILNKQSQTDDKGWSSSLGLDEGLIIPYREEKHVKNITQVLGSELL